MAKSKKHNFEVGQTIHVHKSGGWLVNSGSDKLMEYEVTRVNTVSIYAKSAYSGYERRFDKRTLVSRDSFGDVARIYPNPQDFWDKLERKREKTKLRLQIEGSVENMSLNQLREVMSFIEKGEKTSE